MSCGTLQGLGKVSLLAQETKWGFSMAPCLPIFSLLIKLLWLLNVIVLQPDYIGFAFFIL